MSQIVSLPEGLRARCLDCLSPLDWEPDPIPKELLTPGYVENVCLMFAECCGHRYIMYPESVRIERED